MKMQIIVLEVAFVMGSITSHATTTIDPASKYAYGENVGWVNACGDGANGAVIGQAFCSGFMWGANVGWINLGNGAPVNGVAYQNNSATDYGVNHDGLGNLSGYAYGASIGWVNFEQACGKPKVNLETGRLTGCAWGANVGWINLSSLVTLTIDPGSSADGDNIPDAWELGRTNSIWVLDGGDADNDGISDEGEYLAGTDPFDSGNYLAITDFQIEGNTNLVTWTCVPTRLYTLQYAAALSNGMSWAKTGSSFVPPSGPEVAEMVVGVTDANRFYRVQARPPLSP